MMNDDASSAAAASSSPRYSLWQLVGYMLALGTALLGLVLHPSMTHA